MRHYTNIEQSKHLLELGLDIGTADMYYVSDYSTPRIGVPLGLSPNTPCWTVGALLRLLPKFTLQTIGILYLLVDEKHDHAVDGPSIVDVCYELIAWLLEKKLLKED